MSAIDGHVYAGGRLTGSPAGLREALDQLEQPGTVAWIGLTTPDPATIEDAARLFGLHPLAVEDALKGHQRAKLDRYGDTMFVVLRPAAYDDDAERVDFGEVHLFVGSRFVLTVRRGARPDLTAARDALEADPGFLSIGAEAMLTALMDQVVDGYAPVVTGLEEDIDEVEDNLFGDGSVDPELSERIYRLVEQVMVFQRAIGPLPRIVQDLLRGAGRYGTGEEVKKISSWAAIIFTPTLVASVYGMNFDDMPELHWGWGYPFAVVLMLGLGVTLWGIFKYKRWP
ncbi:magnesium and cobalt transport protein CorA [Actinoplanes sp. CA-054009]